MARNDAGEINLKNHRNPSKSPGLSGHGKIVATAYAELRTRLRNL